MCTQMAIAAVLLLHCLIMLRKFLFWLSTYWRKTARGSWSSSLRTKGRGPRSHSPGYLLFQLLCQLASQKCAFWLKRKYSHNKYCSWFRFIFTMFGLMCDLWPCCQSPLCPRQVADQWKLGAAELFPDCFAGCGRNYGLQYVCRLDSALNMLCFDFCQ